MRLQTAADGTTGDNRSETDDNPDAASVVVGIPAYNEEHAIGSAVLGAQPYADEIVVVDDGSTDETARILEQTDATVVEHTHNLGKGAAVRTLFRHARDIDCDALVLIDGDGQHSPVDIPALVEPIVEGTADVVIGSRYLRRPDDETPAYRRAGQRILDFCTERVAGVAVSDSQSGFRAFSAEAIESMSITTDGMGVESEQLVAAGREGLTVAERPIDARYEGVAGQSLNPIHHGLVVLLSLARMAWVRHPILIAGIPAVPVSAYLLLTGLKDRTDR